MRKAKMPRDTLQRIFSLIRSATGRRDLVKPTIRERLWRGVQDLHLREGPCTKAPRQSKTYE